MMGMGEGDLKGLKYMAGLFEHSRISKTVEVMYVHGLIDSCYNFSKLFLTHRIC